MTPQSHLIDKEQVMAYLDGELAPEQASRAAIHLEQCPECRELAEDLRGVSSQMLVWNVETSSRRLSETIMAAVAESGNREGRVLAYREFAGRITRESLLRKRWVWAAAGVVAVVVCIFSVSSSLFVGKKNASGMFAYRNAQMDKNRVVDMAEYKVEPSPAKTIPAPMIARTASLKITVKDFSAARASMERTVSAHQGYVSELNISTEKGSPQSLTAKLEIPAAQCDAALADLKGIGHVEQEQQGGEEVTAQAVNLDARLKNARETEAQLTEVLRTRTGKIGDVLEVEKEMARVREEIERMEADQKQLRDRVTFASIDLSLSEEYQAQLGDGHSSAGRQIRNALVDGYHAATDGLLSVFLFLPSIGPSLLIWAAILFWPARWAWRRWRKSRADNAAGA